MKETKSLFLGLLTAALYCFIICVPVRATGITVDAETLDMEFTNIGIEVSAVHLDDSYVISLSKPSEQDGFIYAFQRQSLDWSGAQGVGITLKNDSNESMGLSLQLMDESWQPIIISEGQKVLLQKEDAQFCEIATVQDGMVHIPSGFVGNVYLPFFDASDVDVAKEGVLSALRGFGITLAPRDQTTLTLAGVSLWNEEITAIFSDLDKISLEFRDPHIVVPLTGECLTMAEVKGTTTSDIMYSLEHAPIGAKIDQGGRVIVDSTATARELIVSAVIDQKLVVEETLPLWTVWDVKPEDMPLSSYMILDPSEYEVGSDYGRIVRLTDFIVPIQVASVCVIIAILFIYNVWHRGGKKTR